MVLGLLCALAAAVAFGVGALLQAVVARRETATDGVDPRLLLRLLRYPMYLAVLGLYLAGFALHFVALRTAPLFLAQAVISASVAVTAVLAAQVLGAPFGRVEQVAVLAVCAGLFVLAVAADGHGSVTTTADERMWLLWASLGVAVTGGVVGRFHGETATVLLSMVSGVGYAVVAVAGRVLPSFAPSDLLADPATWALAASGVLAFLFYSTALQRAGVLASTSAVVVMQTAVPAVIGIALLGDTVDSGWGVGAAAAFVVALAGVVVLSSRDTLAEESRSPAAPEAGRAVPGVAP